MLSCATWSTLHLHAQLHKVTWFSESLHVHNFKCWHSNIKCLCCGNTGSYGVWVLKKAVIEIYAPLSMWHCCSIHTNDRESMLALSFGIIAKFEADDMWRALLFSMNSNQMARARTACLMRTWSVVLRRAVLLGSCICPLFSSALMYYCPLLWSVSVCFHACLPLCQVVCVFLPVSVSVAVCFGVVHFLPFYEQRYCFQERHNLFKMVFRLQKLYFFPFCQYFKDLLLISFQGLNLFSSVHRLCSLMVCPLDSSKWFLHQICMSFVKLYSPIKSW